MAIQAKVMTLFGEERDCYIRLNNVEASNHGVAAVALFRGFLTKEAFDAGARFVWEQSIDFSPDVSQPLWPQAYAALREQLGAEDWADA